MEVTRAGDPRTLVHLPATVPRVGDRGLNFILARRAPDETRAVLVKRIVPLLLAWVRFHADGMFAPTDPVRQHRVKGAWIHRCLRASQHVTL